MAAATRANSTDAFRYDMMEVDYLIELMKRLCMGRRFYSGRRDGPTHGNGQLIFFVDCPVIVLVNILHRVDASFNLATWSSGPLLDLTSLFANNASQFLIREPNLVLTR